MFDDLNYSLIIKMIENLIHGYLFGEPQQSILENYLKVLYCVDVKRRLFIMELYLRNLLFYLILYAFLLGSEALLEVGVIVIVNFFHVIRSSMNKVFLYSEFAFLLKLLLEFCRVFHFVNQLCYCLN